MRPVHDLRLLEILEGIGTVGAVLSIVGAIIVCVTLAKGDGELAGPVAVWLVGTLLTVAAAFVDLRPVVVSASTGVVMVIATAGRLALEHRSPRRRRTRR